MSPLPQHHGAVATLALSASLLLGGCGLLDSTDDSENGNGGADGTDSEPVTAGAVDPGEEESRETLASQDINALGVDLHVAVHELARGTETVDLTFSVTNIDDEDSDNPHFWLSVGNENNVSGARLVDSDAGTVHLTASDDDGNCVCSHFHGTDEFQPDASIFFSATFGAPPEDVETMDVQIPNAGTFSDVPLD